MFEPVKIDAKGRLPRYKRNLKVEGTKIFSYNTHVAEINHGTREVVKLGYWSPTTSKHTNYVADCLGYDVVTHEENNE